MVGSKKPEHVAFNSFTGSIHAGVFLSESDPQLVALPVNEGTNLTTFTACRKETESTTMRSGQTLTMGGFYMVIQSHRIRLCRLLHLWNIFHKGGVVGKGTRRVRGMCSLLVACAYALLCSGTTCGHDRFSGLFLVDDVSEFANEI